MLQPLKEPTFYPSIKDHCVLTQKLILEFIQKLKVSQNLNFYKYRGNFYKVLRIPKNVKNLNIFKNTSKISIFNKSLLLTECFAQPSRPVFRLVCYAACVSRLRCLSVFSANQPVGPKKILINETIAVKWTSFVSPRVSIG